MAKKNFDSEFCGSLPLNNVNLIQDYGYLIITDRDGLRIIQISENAENILGNSPENLVKSNLADFIKPSDLELIKEAISEEGVQKIPLRITFRNDAPRSVLLHVKPDYLVLEVEHEISADMKDFTSRLAEIQRSITEIENADSVQEISEAAVKTLKKMSGFDGVLMYQFDKDWNGKVIAEKKTSALEPYLGQTFPASDIPKQARDLYLKNPYRQIPKREYQPISLYPVVNPVTDGFLDLSDCNLRSVPSVHREYMKNMGINASMSIRVLNDGQLWGLISCHHIEPKYINMELCAVFELLSSIISSRISDIISSQAARMSIALQQSRIDIMDRLHHKSGLGDSLFGSHLNNVFTLFDISGAVLAFEGNTSSSGLVPDTNFIDELLLWIDNKKLRDVFYTDNLSELFDEASPYKTRASGLLVMPIDPERSEYLICFRPEMEASIDWGGNPNEAITFDADGKNYHPRNSFKLWKERVENYSTAWTNIELDAARSLAAFLARFRTGQIVK